MKNTKQLFLVLGNQLFPLEYLKKYTDAVFFMAEDISLCTDVEHHQQKIVLFLAAMRSYADELKAAGHEVRYCLLDPDESYEQRLSRVIPEYDCSELVHFEIEDRPMERRVADFCKTNDLARTELNSPMFLCDRDQFRKFAGSRQHLRMADFYKQQRQRFKILIDDSGTPTGGKWSFDTDNRKKLPRNVTPPKVTRYTGGTHVKAVTALVAEHFDHHPGNAADFWWPTTRDQALEWLDEFLETRLKDFGPYEDALSQRSETVFHSLLSPLLNLGLLTPREVIDAVLNYADGKDIPIQSVEGLVRQVIGWREFVRGIYRTYGEQQDSANFWSHKRELTGDWYTGTTGLPPLDDAIDTVQRLGWLHHISRLMVVGNLMTLCEINPRTAHRWFMEMFVDSSDWVMGPNVYGMGIFSDGGIFATKPYICGSNYLLKMSDYKKGDWCDTVDGLYWRFIEKHRDFFAANPRLAIMPRALDRLKPERKEKIFAAAEIFLEKFTHC